MREHAISVARDLFEESPEKHPDFVGSELTNPVLFDKPADASWLAGLGHPPDPVTDQARPVSNLQGLAAGGPGADLQGRLEKD